jgi:hypothetical protein
VKGLGTAINVIIRPRMDTTLMHILGFLWSEDDDDDEVEECPLENNYHSFECNICEEKYDTIRDLMKHKKKQHCE